MNAINRPITFVLLLLSMAVQGQEYAKKFYHKGQEDGVVSNYLSAILLDSEGFLWLGSNEGLQKWDGANGEVFNSRNSGLTSNIIYTVYQDRKNLLWIGTIDGLFRYSYQSNEITKFDLKGPDDTPPINCLKEDAKGVLWVGTSDGLCVIKNQRHVEWVLKDDYVRDLDFDRFSNVWLASYNNGLVKVTLDRKVIQQDNNSQLRSIVVAKSGEIWAGTHEQGVIVFSPSGMQVRQYNSPVFGDHNMQNIVNKIHQAETGEIWVAFNDEPVCVFHEASNRLVPHTQRCYNAYLNYCYGVMDIVANNSGSTFFATLGHGLVSVHKEKNAIQHMLGHAQVARKKDTQVRISCFEMINKDSLWVGSSNSGLFLHHQGKVTHYDSTKGFFTQNILDIEEDDQGCLWIASSSDGLIFYNPVSQEYQPVSNRINGAKLHDIHALYLDKSSNILWIGTYGEGLILLDVKSGHIIDYSNNKRFSTNLLDVNWVNHFLKDKHGNLWISSFMGLHRVFQDEITTYRQHQKGLSTDYISMVTELKNGHLLIAGESKGLQLFDGECFTPHAINRQLPEAVQSVIEDDDGRLWIGTSTGLFVYSQTVGTLLKLSLDQGFQPVYSQKAIHLSPDHSLFLGGDNGYNQFQITSLNYSRSNSRLIMNTILVNDSVAIKNSFVPFSLSHNQNDIRFTFTLINQIDNGREFIQYKINENEWKDLSENERSLAFHHLKSGVYRLNVRLFDTVTHTGHIPLLIVFEIHPPWWETTWFRLLIVILTIGGVAVFFMVRTRRIKRRNEFLEVEVKNRTSELEEANNDLQDQYEFIKDSNEKLIGLHEDQARQGEKIRLRQRQLSIRQRDLIQIIHTLKRSGELEVDKLENALDLSFSPSDTPAEKDVDLMDKKLLFHANNAFSSLIWEYFSGLIELVETKDFNSLFSQIMIDQPDFVLLDVGCIEWCKGLKESKEISHIPLLIISAESLDEFTKLAHPADEYLTVEELPQGLLMTLHEIINRQERIQKELITANDLYPPGDYTKEEKAFLNEVSGLIENELLNPQLDHVIICQALGLSRSVLYAKMKSVTGLGVNEFIRMIRLKKSILLLKDENKTVSEIAYEVGFNSASYYIRSFTKQYGVSPKEFIKKRTNDE